MGQARPFVIGAGFGRTGTMSMKKALRQLLAAPIYHFDELLWRPDHVAAWHARLHNDAPIDWRWLYADYSATLDYPFNLYWREMLAAFPDAKVLLTVREPERWHASIATMLRLLRTLEWVLWPLPYGRRVLGVALYHFRQSRGRFGGDTSRENAIRVFEEHIAEVKRSVPEERLLVFDVSKDGWGPLCEFLEVEPPPAGTPFPHANDGMGTIKGLFWQHLWRVYGTRLLLLLLIVLLLLLGGSDLPGPSVAAAAASSRVTTATALSFAARERLMRDPDGRQRIVLDPSSPETEPPNAYPHDVAVTAAGSGDGDAPLPRLFEEGFEFVSLSDPQIGDTLQRMLAEGRLASRHLSGASSIPGNSGASGESHAESLEDTLAWQLQGWAPYWTSAGYAAPAIAVKCAGLVMRRGGLGGEALEGSGDGFDRVARRVHIDQDMDGDPLRERGLVWLFKLPGIELLNLWLPLDDRVVLQPLALMNTSTLDAADQIARLRANSTKNAGGVGGSFASDRLAVLHSAASEFLFKPEMRRGEAIVFPTGVTPHSSFSLPAERPLSALLERLAVVLAGDQAECVAAEPGLAESCGSDEARAGQAALCDLAQQALDLAAEVCAAAGSVVTSDQWDRFQRLVAALDRTSVEVRCVTIWPHRVALPLLLTLAGWLGVRLAMSLLPASG